jgi:UDP-glucose 4-epimerase
VVVALRASAGVEHAIGIESRPRGHSREDSDLDFVCFVPDHRPLVEYFEKERIDAVVQCGLAADRNGLQVASSDADVIGTMCLAAAISQSGSQIRSWVLASSSAVYPIGSKAPLLHHESHEIPHQQSRLGASIAEAEDYSRDVAHRMPHVNIAVLRLQQLVGRDASGPLASLLERRPVPDPIGFDPVIQLLDLEDAANAIAFAIRIELAGIYNVASAGTIRWRRAIRAMGGSQIPVLAVSLPWLEPVLRRLGIPFAPAQLLDLLRFGHAVDTEKLERTGWRPQYDQLDCLRLLANS